MFCTPLAFAWLSAYLSDWIPGFTEKTALYGICGDLLLLSSLIVLGGDFWDKIRSLFVHDAETHFPQRISGEYEK
jgi:hypothetical protein